MVPINPPLNPGKQSLLTDPLVMTNIAMENPEKTWSFIAGKIIELNGTSIGNISSAFGFPKFAPFIAPSQPPFSHGFSRQPYSSIYHKSNEKNTIFRWFSRWYIPFIIH